MGSDLFKLLAVGVAIGGIVSLTVALGVSMPMLVGALLWVGVDMVVSDIWEQHNVEDYIVNRLKEFINVQ